MLADAKVIISVQLERDCTVIAASGCVDVELLADIANAARLVSVEGPAVLDLYQLATLDEASAALVAKWTETGIVSGIRVVRVITRPAVPPVDRVP
jgi:hypothetical protein